MADRRDVPRVVVALHLRPRLPGRAHRARARARAGLLLLRRARVREEGQGARSRSSPSSSATTSGSSSSVGLKKGVWAKRRQGRVAHPPASTTRASSSTAPASPPARLRAAPARDEHRASTSARPSRRCAGSCRSAPSTATRRTTSVTIGRSPSSAATAGARAARSSRWWCTEAPEAFTGARARLPVDGARAAQDARRRACTSEVAKYLRRAPRLRRRRRCRTPPRCQVIARPHPDPRGREPAVSRRRRAHGRAISRPSRRDCMDFVRDARRRRVAHARRPRGAGTCATRSRTSPTPTRWRSTPATGGPRALNDGRGTRRVRRGRDLPGRAARPAPARARRARVVGAHVGRASATMLRAARSERAGAVGHRHARRRRSSPPG